jgi:hypothetical protein
LNQGPFNPKKLPATAAAVDGQKDLKVMTKSYSSGDRKATNAALPASEANRRLIEAALAVGKHHPVFPTNNKKPCWSNAELGVAKGQGGYKIATQDQKEIERLFSHPRATEIAVPMGSASGLLCVDVDTYKDDAGLTKWLSENRHLLKNTLCHKTRSGGLHYIFKHPGDEHRFPAQLRPGVDLKALGNGYICWPGTKGYEVINNVSVKKFPLELAENALKARGGTGRTTQGSSFNDLTNDELVGQVQDGSVFYPALRSLALRLPRRKHPGTGERQTIDEQIQTLYNVMDISVAADQAVAESTNQLRKHN